MISTSADIDVRGLRHALRGSLTVVSFPSEMIDKAGGWAKRSVGDGCAGGYAVSPMKGWMLKLAKTIWQI
jgi:hypothetical protein